MKVKQISLDIVVGDLCDGCDLAEEIANELTRRAYTVVGAGFQEDMTEFYKENYPELLENFNAGYFIEYRS